MTVLRNTQRGLATAEQRLHLMQSVTRIWTEAETLDSASARILEAAADALGWQLTALWVVAGDVIQCAEMWCEGSESSELASATRGTRYSCGEGLPGRVWATARAEWITDLSTEPDLRRANAASRDGFASAFAFPIIVDRAVIGVIEFFRHDRTERDEDLLEMFKPLGDQIGLFVERKRSEESLRESEERYRVLAEASPLAVWIVKAGGEVTYLNRRFTEYTGVDDSRGLAHGWEDLVHPDELAEFRKRRNSTESQNGFRLEARFRNKAGDYRWQLVEIVPIRSGQGGPTSWLGTAVDIHDQKQAELALADETQIATVLRGIGTALTSELDVERVVQLVTDAATRLTGAQFGAFFYNAIDDHGESYLLYTLSGVERENFARFSMPRNTAVFSPTFNGERTIRSGDVTADPEYGKSAPYFGMPEGHLPVRSYLAVPVVSRSKAVLGGLFFGHEATDVFTEHAERIAEGIASWAAVAMDNATLFRDLQQSTEQLRQANEAKAEFLGLVSHELRTPLTIIRGNAETLSRRFAKIDEDDRQHALLDIVTESERLERILKNLLTLARLEQGKDLESEPVLVVRVIEGVIGRRQQRTSRRTYEIASAGDPRPVTCPEGYLDLVVENLLSNAEKYSPSYEPISVAVECADAEVRVRVLDRGVGVGPDATRLFESFYRSERVNQITSGLGVGLAVCKRLIEAQGGSLWARSREGGGSEFGFSLPVSEE